MLSKFNVLGLCWNCK